MSDHPIILTADEVRGVLTGTRTQIRHPILPTPPRTGEYRFSPAPTKAFWNEERQRWWLVPDDVEDHDPSPHTLYEYRCPYGAVGHTLWVREPWAQPFIDSDTPVYLADTPRHLLPSWRSGVTMPKSAARLRLRVTDLRVQQLHHISDADARAEGVTLPDRTCTLYDGIYREAYRRQWIKRHGRAYAWNINWHVWAISFERILSGLSQDNPDTV